MYLQILFIAACFIRANNAKGTIYYTDPEGGVVTSPGFPNTYPNNCEQKYLITAPENHLVVLNFTLFQLQSWRGSRRTDYLKIVDGKVRKNHKLVLRGYHETPLVLLSKSNSFRLKMISDHTYSYQGFKAKYYFIDKATYCNKTALESRHTSIVSCIDEIKDYAKRCHVQSKGFNKVVQCEEGEFIELTRSIKPALTEESVRQCEDTDMETCPYSLDEILEYYETHMLSYSGLSAEEREAAMASADFDLPSFGRSVGCPLKFCRVSKRTKRFLTPKKCGNLSRSPWRMKCIRCRFMLNCGKRSGGYFSKKR